MCSFSLRRVSVSFTFLGYCLEETVYFIGRHKVLRITMKDAFYFREVQHEWRGLFCRCLADQTHEWCKNRPNCCLTTWSCSVEFSAQFQNLWWAACGGGALKNQLGLSYLFFCWNSNALWQASWSLKCCNISLYFARIQLEHGEGNMLVLSCDWRHQPCCCSLAFMKMVTQLRAITERKP